MRLAHEGAKVAGGEEENTVAERGERAVGERQERGAEGVGGGGEQLEEEDLPVEDGARRLLKVRLIRWVW